jgi:N-acetylglutamate synthase-like GNAT family acetyltransferase
VLTHTGSRAIKFAVLHNQPPDVLGWTEACLYQNKNCSMQIRAARREDAVSACALVRCSITELCHQDHRGDSATIAAWLANKTTENMCRWIDQSHVFVATEETVILGVGAIAKSGEITLNYVSPAARFRGISKAILARLETQAAELGVKSIVLQSTATARRFYLSVGYTDNDRPVGGFGVTICHPMIKRLTSSVLT